MIDFSGELHIGFKVCADTEAHAHTLVKQLIGIIEAEISKHPNLNVSVNGGLA